ncbi:hypothetical protein D0Z07_8328 [Hyphodiscus hymeniophilus]|uniref:A-kinase anchor protein 7-like phosphoesterase domain-containing protein n=1 Tax=Hyphodiscus hymeniophilus TaxID=353542 RepID=A0A9P6VEE3_9HELO|nr:hypothetical protein D0Z07_8328 [Hyphodiscus hymeniophilus]
MPPKAPPPRLTHFLCIPLVTPQSRPQLQTSLNKFRADVTSSIPEKAIRPIGTLHLTIGVMSLLTQERIDRALGVLRNLDLKEMLSQVSESQDLRVTLRGLKAMHAPSKTAILYAPPVDEDPRLQAFCQKLWVVFKEAGFLVPDSRPLLLHATIVNTVYVPTTRDRGGHGRYKERLTFDARDIIERYEGYQWMSDVKVENIVLYQMGAKRSENGDEEYVAEGKARMP